MLGPTNLVSYLMSRALISAGDVVDANLKIVDISRRNRNFMIHRDAGASYMLKQGVDRATVESIANEAQVYRALESAGGFRGRFCPRLVDFDEEESVLVLELFPDAPSLHDHYLRCGRFSRRTAQVLGKALGDLHVLPDLGSRPDSVLGRGATRPWVFSLWRPDLQLIFEISQANLDLIRILQKNAEFLDAIERLIAGWTVEALIHGDVRWENCLLAARDGRRELKIVDWELAGPGDPCWDVGSVFGAYCGFWLQSLPVTASTAPERFVEGARYPLAAMRPAILAFWKAYARTRRLDAAAARRCLLRSIGFGAVRLVQGAFERMQDAGELIGNAVCALQLSRNMLARPEAAAALLGLGA